MLPFWHPNINSLKLSKNMRKVYLLKPYRDYQAGEIITVSNNVAFGLIEQKIARKCTNRDFLVKPEFGETKAIDLNKLSKSRSKRSKRKK